MLKETLCIYSKSSLQSQHGVLKSYYPKGIQTERGEWFCISGGKPYLNISVWDDPSEFCHRPGWETGRVYETSFDLTPETKNLSHVRTLPYNTVALFEKKNCVPVAQELSDSESINFKGSKQAKWKSRLPVNLSTRNTSGEEAAPLCSTSDLWGYFCLTLQLWWSLESGISKKPSPTKALQAPLIP